MEDIIRSRTERVSDLLKKMLESLDEYRLNEDNISFFEAYENLHFEISEFEHELEIRDVIEEVEDDVDGYY